MRKVLLFVTIALVISLSLISIAPSVMAAGPVRPTPQGCVQTCWNLNPTATLTVNPCTGVWSLTGGTPVAGGTGSVRQYGVGNGSIVVVRDFNTSTSVRFYALGVINGNASVYVVNTSSLAKYTLNGTYCGPY